MDLKQVALPLYEARGWMKLLGVVNLISGILVAITIVGILVAWLPIWLGVLLFQAAVRVEGAFSTEDEELLRVSLGKLKLFFLIQGVLMLIVLGFFAVGLLMGGIGTLSLF